MCWIFIVIFITMETGIGTSDIFLQNFTRFMIQDILYDTRFYLISPSRSYNQAPTSPQRASTSPNELPRVILYDANGLVYSLVFI